MGLIKEPFEVDLIIHSKPWTEKELTDFRKLMIEQKSKRSKAKIKQNKKQLS